MSILGTGFVYTAHYTGPTGVTWTEEVHNRIPQEGVDFVAGLLTATVSLVSPWYVGIFENDYTPVDGSSAGALVTSIGETTSYEAANRPTFVSVYDNASRIDNNLNRAEFVFTADKRIYGGFLTSTQAKQDTSGVLLSIARFTSPRDVEAGGTLRVLAGIQLVPSL
jgi:hypothetical protein